MTKLDYEMLKKMFTLTDRFLLTRIKKTWSYCHTKKDVFNWLWNLHILQEKILGIVKAVQKTVWLETARMFWTLFGLWVLYLGNRRKNVDDDYDADDLDDDDGDDSAVVDDSDDYDEMIMTLY